MAGGDLITAINGRPIKDWIDYLEYLELDAEVVDTITLTVLWGNVELELEAMVIAQP